MIVAHGSVVRCIVKLLNHMSDSEIEKFDVPTAMPYVFEFDAQLNVFSNQFKFAANIVFKLLSRC